MIQKKYYCTIRVSYYINNRNLPYIKNYKIIANSITNACKLAKEINENEHLDDETYQFINATSLSEEEIYIEI